MEKVIRSQAALLMGTGHMPLVLDFLLGGSRLENLSAVGSISDADALIGCQRFPVESNYFLFGPKVSPKFLTPPAFIGCQA